MDYREPLLWRYAANWISPSRGLLVFTPVFLFSLAEVYLSLRERWLFPLAPYFAVIIALHSVLIAQYWPGHTYGPRYFTDMAPFFVVFLVPAVDFWRKMPLGGERTALAAAFVAFAAWGVFVHARGATSTAAQQWNSVPVSVDGAKQRVWDWSDPQFLRGLR
jgi:hypothetical protein